MSTFECPVCYEQKPNDYAFHCPQCSKYTCDDCITIIKANDCKCPMCRFSFEREVVLEKVSAILEMYEDDIEYIIYSNNNGNTTFGDTIPEYRMIRHDFETDDTTTALKIMFTNNIFICIKLGECDYSVFQFIKMFECDMLEKVSDGQLDTNDLDVDIFNVDEESDFYE